MARVQVAWLLTNKLASMDKTTAALVSSMHGSVGTMPLFCQVVSTLTCGCISTLLTCGQSANIGYHTVVVAQ
jgi:hypothetical protein